MKTRILGMIDFKEDHATANNSENLIDLHPDFGAYPRNSDGGTPQCLDAVRLDKLLYFRIEPLLDIPVLTSDCGSDVSVGAKKTSFGIGIVVLVIAWI